MGTMNLTQAGGTVNESVPNAFQGAISLNLVGGTTNLNQANGYLGGANISGTNLTIASVAGRSTETPTSPVARCSRTSRPAR